MKQTFDPISVGSKTHPEQVLRLLRASPSQRHVLCTADYISPEQVHGTTELNSRTDQYSFAVMTYQLLTGHKPFERNNTWAMIRSHLEELPPDPRIHVRMPEHTANALLKALSKKPEDRFESVGEFVKELGRTDVSQ